MDGGRARRVYSGRGRGGEGAGGAPAEGFSPPSLARSLRSASLPCAPRPPPRPACPPAQPRTRLGAPPPSRAPALRPAHVHHRWRRTPSHRGFRSGPTLRSTHEHLSPYTSTPAPAVPFPASQGTSNPHLATLPQMNTHVPPTDTQMVHAPTSVTPHSIPSPHPPTLSPPPQASPTPHRQPQLVTHGPRPRISHGSRHTPTHPSPPTGREWTFRTSGARRSVVVPHTLCHPDPHRKRVVDGGDSKGSSTTPFSVGRVFS